MLDKLLKRVTILLKKEGEMAKTVYSLVLDDEVMKLVDKAARRGGLSRSAYINQALAENVGY